MHGKISLTPTNLIMGFLGVGKTTAIVDLLKQKPKDENWAVLVNEFGKVGVDGAIFSAAGVAVKEIPGGCLCCAVALPFQVGINRLLKEVRPDRLLIEPTGLGHPKKVLDMLLSVSFKGVLDVRASLCLVDPEKLKDPRYTRHENFVDQIALSDVLVANKMDLAEVDAVQLFHQWAKNSIPDKTLVAQTTQGHLDVAWLDLARHEHRNPVYPDAHPVLKYSPLDSDHLSLINKADGYQSFGYHFPARHCFDYQKLYGLFNKLDVVRLKAIVHTDQGWLIINQVDKQIQSIPLTPSALMVNSRIELIAIQDQQQDITEELNHCQFSQD